MSGTSDPTTPYQRQAFDNAVAGSGGPVLTAATAAVAQSTARMPETTAFLLGMAYGATYAAGAALLQARWASGRAGL